MALINFVSIAGVPAPLVIAWNVTFSTMRDSVFVGTRMESAMKPMLLTCGMTWERASAAFVDVRMILFRILRFFRRSFAPAFGTESSTDCVLVAA